MPEEQTHVYTYYRDASDDAELIALSEHTLSAEEHRRARRFQRTEARNRFAISRTLLRQCLSAHTGVPGERLPITQGPRGKPGLERNGSDRLVYFNVSHCNQLIALTVSRQYPVGIDVEDMRPRSRLMRIIEAAFDPSEIQTLSEVTACEDQIALFYRYWCMKEAYTKALGLGLHRSFNSFCVEFGKEAVSVVDPRTDTRDFTFHEYSLSPRYHVSLCAAGPLPNPPRLRSLNGCTTPSGSLLPART